MESFGIGFDCFCGRELSNNGLTSLENGLFNDLKELQQLFVISFLTDSLLTFTAYRQLDFNAIETIPATLFQNLTSLLILFAMIVLFQILTLI